MVIIENLKQATLIMDIAAILILIGMIYYTTIYRKRRRTDDRMFFGLLIMDVILAVADAVTYMADGSAVPALSVLSIICNNIFFIVFELLCCELTMYLDYRHHKDYELTKKRRKFFFIPALVTVVLILINNVKPFLFEVDIPLTEYHSLDLYPVIFIAPIIYGIIAVILILRIDKRAALFFVFLIAMRVLLGNLLNDVSSTALIFAVALIFIHINVMKYPFYEEDVNEYRS